MSMPKFDEKPAAKEPKSNVGGARPGAGRKPLSPTEGPTRTHNIRLTDADWEDFKALGGPEYLRKQIRRDRHRLQKL